MHEALESVASKPPFVRVPESSAEQKRAQKKSFVCATDEHTNLDIDLHHSVRVRFHISLQDF